jgi:hypothetical protein
MVNVPATGDPTMITTSRHPVEQGWTPPSLAGHHHQPGESLLCVGTYLGLFLCHDVGFCLLIGIWLHLLHT